MDILYHYCSTEAFQAIASNKSLRLSSLSLANDYMEGKLVAKAIAKLAANDDLGDKYTAQIQASVALLEEYVDALGFCLSQEGDLLSQWRGYANDAHGVAIGFSKDYLHRFVKAHDQGDEWALALEEVQYDEVDHVELVKPAYLRVKKMVDGGKLKGLLGGTKLSWIGKDEQELAELQKEERDLAASQIHAQIMDLSPKLFLLKGKAFEEEREWRLSALHIRGTQELSTYRAVSDRIIPYRELALTEIESQPIARVILGPKHITPKVVMQDFFEGKWLWQSGHCGIHCDLPLAPQKSPGVGRRIHSTAAGRSGRAVDRR